MLAPRSAGGANRRVGKRLASLGVHEHWNNSADRQYSRNLGQREGIELVKFAVRSRK